MPRPEGDSETAAEASNAVRMSFDKALIQNISLMPSCTCRDDPDSPVGNRVFVIRPKPGLPTTFPGWPKFAWLKRSKNSARNCTRILSPNAVFFIMERSVLLNPGPTITLRPKLPKRETGINTEVSNQRSTLPMIVIGPVTSGRSVLATPVTVLLVVTILTGLPLCICRSMRELPALDEPVAAEGQFIYCVDDDAVARVEVRQTAVSAQVIAVLHDDALGAERVIVERLRPGVVCVDLQALREPFAGRDP